MSNALRRASTSNGRLRNLSRATCAFVAALLFLAANAARAQTIIDDGDAGFATIGTWPSDASGYNGDSRTHAAGTGTNSAQWTFTGLAAGYYQVSATWSENAGLNTGTATFQTTSSDGPSSTVVDQRVAPDDFIDAGTSWENLGFPARVQSAGGMLTIQLSDNTASGRVVADAVRIDYLANPEILITDATGGGVEMVDGVSVSDLGQTTLGGVSLFRTFSVRNYGASALSIGTLTLPLGYSLISAPASSLPAATGFGFSTTTFSVQLPSTVASPFIGQVSLVNGDSDESPYTFTLNGDVTNVLPTSNIVDDGGAGYSDTGLSLSPTAGFSGDQREVPSASGSATWTFTGLIPNSPYRVSATWVTTAGATSAAPFSMYLGSVAPANLAGSILIDQTIEPNDFIVDGATWEDLGGAYRTDASGTLIVQLTMPGAGFALADAVRVDPVTGPEIQVTYGSTVFMQDDRDTVALGKVSVGTPVPQNFTIRNFGSSILTLGTPALSGSGDFGLSAAPSATVAAGGSTAFTIIFQPSANGLKTAHVSLTTNDTDENPFDFTITGIGCSPITLGTLPDGTDGAAYSGSTAASGGVAPYTYALTSGALPDGLMLTPSGMGAGDVTGPASSTGTFLFQITATDANTCTGAGNYSVVIDPAPTHTPSPSPTETSTSTPTETATDTPTPSPSPTPSNTPSSATCPLTPATTCATPGAGGKSQLQLRTDSTDLTGGKDKLKWKFKGGPALAQSDFGDPTATASYALCVYDDGVLRVEANVGPSAMLWADAGSKGYVYKDKAGTADGVSKIKMLGGAIGKARLQVKGKGANLPPLTPVSMSKFFNDATSVVAQLHQDGGECYETSFTSTDEKKNDGQSFKAKK